MDEGEDVPSCSPLEGVQVDKNVPFPMTSWDNATKALTSAFILKKESDKFTKSKVVIRALFTIARNANNLIVQ